ncbi:MAG: alpha/beta hydrolase, partial [Verrucomicrobiia bacterium]
QIAYAHPPVRTTPQRRRQKGTSRSCDKTRRRQKAGEPIVSIAFWREGRNGFFWANNNYDRWATNTSLGGALYTDVEQDDQQIAFCPAYPGTPTPDCNYSNVLANGYAYRAIPCTRDLQDFFRLWVCGIDTNLIAKLPAGSTVTLNWGDVGSPNSGNPTIDLFEAADADGGIGYLTNETVATAQINPIQCPYIGRLAPGGSIQLNASQFNGWAGSHFIMCGVNYGKGGLNLTITDGSGNVLAQSTTYLQILDIKQMYERWTVGDNPNITATNVPYLATENLPPFTPAFRYTQPQDTNTAYILHVHGFNMQTWEKDRYAETEFKRLYWQGYKGRFGEFRWPTTSKFYTKTFDDSESNAWASAKGLLNLLTNLNSQYPGKVYLTAHSHGNVVAGEALRLAGNNQVVNTYIAMQGAVPAHSYDPTAPVRLLNSTGVNLDSGTPNCYAQYYTTGAPCYFNSSAGARTYVDFFNTNDWALTTLWRPDQDLKPDLGYGYDGTHFYSGYVSPFLTYLLFPVDTYTIFSYCDEARCQAIGAQANVGGVFSTSRQIDLRQSPYNFGDLHIYHSGEFRSDYPQRWQFWNQAMVQMNLK